MSGRNFTKKLIRIKQKILLKQRKKRIRFKWSELDFVMEKLGDLRAERQSISILFKRSLKTENFRLFERYFTQLSINYSELLEQRIKLSMFIQAFKQGKGKLFLIPKYINLYIWRTSVLLIGITPIGTLKKYTLLKNKFSDRITEMYNQL